MLWILFADILWFLCFWVQFLNEARQHKVNSNTYASSPHVEPEGGRRSGAEKRGKKSWKSSLLSWWKSEKKVKPRVESATNVSRKPKPRKGHTSGPVLGSSIREAELPRHRPTSGPLSGLFGKGKRSENETPYVTLVQTGQPKGASPYGPLYLVT